MNTLTIYYKNSEKSEVFKNVVSLTVDRTEKYDILANELETQFNAITADTELDAEHKLRLARIKQSEFMLCFKLDKTDNDELIRYFIDIDTFNVCQRCDVE